MDYCNIVMRKRRAQSREGWIITTIALPPELHRRLMLAALDEHATGTELVRDALQEFLDRREQQQKERKPS
jgi:predicted transcriptional regulator